MAWRKKDTKAVASLISLFFMALAGAVALPFVGGRNLVRGYDREFAATIFFTIALNAALIGAGFVLGIFALPLVFALFGGVPVSSGSGELNYGPVLTVTIVSVFVGVVIGLSQRPARLEAFAIARDNAQFLTKTGIRETGQNDVTHYDPNNHPLRYMETIGDKQMYMAVGRRNKRAYIYLDQSGRMVRYSGIVSL